MTEQMGALGVECAPETKGRRIRVEFFESHDGERCDCIASSVSQMTLSEGDTITLSEDVSCDRCGVTRKFALNVTLVEVVADHLPVA